MVVLPGWVLVCMGFSQPLEWAEFPLIVDLFVILAFVLMLVQFVKPFLEVPAGDLYVSGWYIIGGLSSRHLRTLSAILFQSLSPGRRVQLSVAFGFTMPSGSSSRH